MLSAGGKLYYHRHGNNPPNWGDGEKGGPVTLETPPDGSSQAFDQTMKELGYRYGQALCVGVGLGIAYAGHPNAGANVTSSCFDYLDLLRGGSADIPYVPITDIINPGPLW